MAQPVVTRHHAAEPATRSNLTFRDYAIASMTARPTNATVGPCHNSRPSSCQQSSQRCSDGLAPGNWTSSSIAGCPYEWCTPSCQYATFTEGAARRCLHRRWLHFTGDSHARNLYDAFSAFLGCPTYQGKSAAVRYDEFHECQASSARVSYLFRNKMMRQRKPREDRTEEDDLHTNFFVNSSRSGSWPDVLVLSIGMHEAFAWDKRPLPEPKDLDLGRLAADTRDFLALLLDELRFPGQLVWWKPPYLANNQGPGVHNQLREYPAVRGFYEQAAETMQQLFAERKKVRPDIQLADFYQTTRGRKAVSGGHYHDLAPFHNNVLLNLVCRRS